METLDQIKQQLAELTAKVEGFKTNETGEYTFTQKEMIKFVKDLNDEFMSYVAGSTRGLDFDDAVDINLCGRELEVDVDNDMITREIIDNICIDDSDDAILDTVAEIYRNIKA